MQKNYTLLLLIVLFLLLVGVTGSIGSVIDINHINGLNRTDDSDSSLHRTVSPAENTGLQNFSIDSFIVALYANSEGIVNKSPYVSRARDLLDRNENRNALLQFITENPGAIQYDMNRSLNMNIGTLRYHLMILCLNHRVIPYQDGAKRVRYFANNGTYSVEQMKVISLLKREPTCKLLGTLVGQTNMTNARISMESGLSYSDINRYLKELTTKGIVIKESTGGDRYQYRLAPDYEDYIAQNIRL